MIVAFVTPAIFTSLFAVLNHAPICNISNTSADAVRVINPVVPLGINVIFSYTNLCCGLYMRPTSSMNIQFSKVQFIYFDRDIFLLSHIDVRPQVFRLKCHSFVQIKFLANA